MSDGTSFIVSITIYLKPCKTKKNDFVSAVGIFGQLSWRFAFKR